MTRRKRGNLTDDDREIWSRFVQTTVPLRPVVKKPSAFHPKPTPVAQKHLRPMIKPLTQIGRHVPEARITINLATDPMKAVEKSRNQMDRKNFDRLRKGKIKPDAKLDLHGMTAAEAHSELRAFIFRCHSADKRLALIVTGKGNTTRAEEGFMPIRQGILRHSVPHWLEAPDIRPKILEVTPAHARHGGGGAYYVYLRRLR